jgi:hypothetical protein
MGEVSGRCVNDEEDHRHGDLVATLAVTGRADLTDAQWGGSGALPAARIGAGQATAKWIRRQLIDAIRWQVRGHRGGTCRRATRPGLRLMACSAAGRAGRGRGCWPGCRRGRMRPG